MVDSGDAPTADDAMEPIPEPELLDAEQLLLTCHDADSARRIIRDVCEYGQQLWDQLYGVRRYLLDATSEGHARPSGPRDDVGWENWMAVYAEVTRALAGRRGDAGFAVSEAELEARRRRHATQPSARAQRGG